MPETTDQNSQTTGGYLYGDLTGVWQTAARDPNFWDNPSSDNILETTSLEGQVLSEEDIQIFKTLNTNAQKQFIEKFTSDNQSRLNHPLDYDTEKAMILGPEYQIALDSIDNNWTQRWNDQKESHETGRITDNEYEAIKVILTTEITYYATLVEYDDLLLQKEEVEKRVGETQKTNSAIAEQIETLTKIMGETSSPDITTEQPNAQFTVPSL